MHLGLSVGVTALRDRAGGGGGGPPALINGPWFGEGATSPIYSATAPVGEYDPLNDRTVIGGESAVGQTRQTRVFAYYHGTGAWVGPYLGFQGGEVDDDHGAPAFAIIQGRAWAFGGPHNADMSCGYEATPGDLSSWTIRTKISGGLWTYPHPDVIGNNIYLFMRDFRGGSRYLLAMRPINNAHAGAGTLGSVVDIFDWTSLRVYQGNHIVVGTKIWFLTTQASFDDSIRQHVYGAIYDTADGSLSNFDGSYVRAAGTLPVNLTDANANFRLVDMGSEQGIVPKWLFDENGRPCIIYTQGTEFALNVNILQWNGTSFDAPQTIGTTNYRYNTVCLVRTPTGIQAFWSKDPSGVTFPRGGNIITRQRVGGVWGTETTFATPSRSYGLDTVAEIRNAHPDARMAYQERQVGSAVEVTNGLYVWMYGDRGYVGRALVPENFSNPAITGSTTQGQTITGTVGQVVNNPDSYEYRYLADAAVIPGATASNYASQVSDVGKMITMQARGVSNIWGPGPWATSNAIGPIVTFSLDARTTAFLAALPQQPDTTHRDLYDAFFATLRANGDDTLILSAALFAGHDAANTALVNMWTPGTNNPIVHGGVTFTDNRGVVSNGTNGWIELPYAAGLPRVMGLVVASDSSAANGSAIIGNADSYLTLRDPSGNWVNHKVAYTSGTTGTTAQASAAGVVGAIRTATSGSNSHRARKRTAANTATSVGNGSNTAIATLTEPNIVRVLTSIATAFTAQRCGIALITTGMDATQSGRVFEAVNTLHQGLLAI